MLTINPDRIDSGQISASGNGRRSFHGYARACLPLLLLISAACVSSPSLSNENRLAPAPSESKLTELDRDIESMRTADFEYIFVFRRKDGGKLDGQDKKYLRENSPPETNRFLMSDDERAAIAGLNDEFDAKYLNVLGKRFTIEDRSRRKAGDENKASNVR